MHLPIKTSLDVIYLFFCTESEFMLYYTVAWGQYYKICIMKVFLSELIKCTHNENK